MDEQAIGRSPLEAFAAVPDPRKRRGRRQSPTVVQALGFTRERTPCVATLHLAFKALDAPVFKAALARWAQGRVGGGRPRRQGAAGDPRRRVTRRAAGGRVF